MFFKQDIFLILMSKEEHNKIAKIENLIWEIAQILQPSSYIENQKINEAKKTMLQIFKD